MVYHSHRPRHAHHHHTTPVAVKSVTHKDAKYLEKTMHMNVQSRRVGRATVQYDANDPRPHTLHKAHTARTTSHRQHKGFFKTLYGTFRTLEQHHLKNKEERARIKEEEARAALARSEAESNVIRAKGEAKRNEELGYAEVQRAKGEKYARIGEGIRSTEQGFGEGIKNARTTTYEEKKG